MSSLILIINNVLNLLHHAGVMNIVGAPPPDLSDSRFQEPRRNGFLGVMTSQCYLKPNWAILARFHASSFRHACIRSHRYCRIWWKLLLGKRSAFLGDSGLARIVGKLSGCGGARLCVLSGEMNPETRLS